MNVSVLYVAEGSKLLAIGCDYKREKLTEENRRITNLQNLT